MFALNINIFMALNLIGLSWVKNLYFYVKPASSSSIFCSCVNLRWRLPLYSTNIQKKKRGFPTKSRILLILTQPVCITIVIFWFHGVTI